MVALGQSDLPGALLGEAEKLTGLDPFAPKLLERVRRRAPPDALGTEERIAATPPATSDPGGQAALRR